MVNYKKVIDLKPDIIICNKEENTTEIVANCEKISQVYVSDIYSIDDNLEFIRNIGILFSIETKARKLINELHDKLNEFESFIAYKPQQKVAYFIWREPWMIAANNNFINELLKINRFKNVFEHLDRYPEIELSSLKKLNLDYVLLSSEPYPFKEKHIQELAQHTSAKILFVDGEYFSWYGSRLIKAFEYFKTLPI